MFRRAGYHPSSARATSWSRLRSRSREHHAGHTRRAAPRRRTSAEPLVSVVIPCLNEEENIEACVRRALEVLREHDIAGEVVVADNASEDRSAELAEAAGRARGHRAAPRLRLAPTWPASPPPAGATSSWPTPT